MTFFQTELAVFAATAFPVQSENSVQNGFSDVILSILIVPLKAKVSVFRESHASSKIISLFIGLFVASCSKNAISTLDKEARYLADEKFAAMFALSEEGYVVEETHQGGYGYPDTWSLVLFKDVAISVTKENLSEVDTMNDVTWRGAIIYEAKLMREFTGVNTHARNSEAFGGVTPKDWSTAGQIFSVYAEQKGGKWSLEAKDNLGGNDYPKKPSTNEMREFEIATRKSKN